MPPSLTLTGEAISDFQVNFLNATLLCNVGPADLTGVKVSTSLSSSQNLSVNVRLQGGGSLSEGACIPVDITASGTQPTSMIFVVQFQANEGTSTTALVTFHIHEILPTLQIYPPSVNTRIARGGSRVLQFVVTNIGRATAHQVQPVIPAVDFLSFISFGSADSSGKLDLESGESASLSVLVKTIPSYQLGEITASLYLTSNEVFQEVPVSLLISSHNLMNLMVVVEDEYTYFANGDPLVNNAVITLTNYQRGLRIVQRTEEGNGSTVFFNIYEDRYELFVEAPNHRSIQQVFVTSVNDPILTIFLERQAVTISWSVTRVSYDDSYTLTVEADFETNVPIPVVTVTPNEFDLEEIERGFIDLLQLNVTNHGLVRADNVNILLPASHPFLEFSIENDQLGDLNPLTSVTVIVQVSRKADSEKNIVLTARLIVYLFNIGYSYICGQLQNRNIPVVLKKEEIVKTDIPILPNIIQCLGGCGGGPVGGPGGGRPLLSLLGYTSQTPAFCNKCLQSLIGCIPTPNFPLAGCIPLLVDGGGLNLIIDALKWINCILPTKWLSNALCISDVYKDCFSTQASQRKKRSLVSNVQNHLEGMYPIDLSVSVAMEVLGDPVWLSVGDSQWLSSVLKPAMDDVSEDGVLVSSSEFLAILKLPTPNGTTVNDVQKLVERLNNTLSGWNSGNLEPINGSDMASFSTTNRLFEEIRKYNEIAMTKGFSSYLESYAMSTSQINRLSRWEEEDPEGVCAVVRIRIEQELAITRDAFLAKLEIDNKEDSDLDGMDLEIIITDSNADVSTHLFSISNATLSGMLHRVKNMWLLPSRGSGTAEWLIVPYTEAAPQSDHVYNVGGNLRYTVDNENIIIPLLPTLITVAPDPSLLVHYFWEKKVIADDPFTDERELSIPFTLGVMVKNAGYGTASSLTLTSGQPEIIENEKGLLVDFMIIGAKIGNGSISPSLSLVLGDIFPGTSIVVRWCMISSLQGEFKNYSATFENVNPLGDPLLSIIDELVIHELIRNVRIYGSTSDDGVLDFLASDQLDLESLPDTLYNSENLEHYNVSRGEVISVRPVPDTSSTIEVRTRSNMTGWVYYKYRDTNGYLTQPALSLNSTRFSSNNSFSIPPENSWITEDSATMDPQVSFILNILDFVQETEDIVFHVTLCTTDCTPVAIPYVLPIATLPPAAATQLPPSITEETTAVCIVCIVMGSFSAFAMCLIISIFIICFSVHCLARKRLGNNCNKPNAVNKSFTMY